MAWVVLFVVCIVSSTTAWDGSRRIRDLVGGGNLPSGKSIPAEGEAEYQVLKQIQAHNGRLNLYPGNYVNGSCPSCWDHPYTDAAEPSMKLAYQHKVAPVLLFEYYSRFYNSTGLGNYNQWYNVGRTFALRFAPGGSFGKENGYDPNYGITYYSAFNEVDDGTDFCPKRGKLDPNLYIQSLIGLSDGVKSVNTSLRVTPGGWMSLNAFQDYTLCGFGPLIAPLLQNGTLDGLDLHTYFNVIYAPMANQYTRSAQYNFHQVLLRNNVTRPVAFYSTEFNFNRKYITEELAAPVFLTAIWDTLGVVDLEGNPANQLALPWNIFNSNVSDPNYGMANGTSPYSPTRRGQVLNLVLQVAGDFTIVSSDPEGTGVLRGIDVAEDSTRELFVWQNVPKWTNMYGTSFVLECDTGTSSVDVYTWEGLWKSVKATTMPMNLTGLPKNNTLMFVCD
eukprot:m.47202 g.47202  ORF g.47202 m.47202 type:complete len:447 (+) comp13209_c0_seq2:2-1342(+)